MSRSGGPIAAQEAAVGVMREFFLALDPDRFTRVGNWTELNARALVARLASHDPPILLAFPDELKEE